MPQHRPSPIARRQDGYAPRPRRTRHTGRLAGAAALLASLAATSARAIDLETARPPLEILDHQVTSGGRTLHLPDGRWFLVDHQVVPVDGAPASAGPIDSAYLVEVEGDAVVLAARLGLLRHDYRNSAWSPTPCAGEGDIYMKEHSAVMGQPDCVAVWGKHEYGVAHYLRFSKPALAWLDARGMRLPDDVVGIKVSRFATNTFGVVLLAVPAEHFDSNAAAIDWAESLRRALKPLLEHRDNDGRWPPLPPAQGASSP